MGSAPSAFNHPLPLESVISTHELRSRPARIPSHRKVNLALIALAKTMANSPESILQTLVETSLELCRAHSSGISLLEEENGQELFRWHGVAGKLAPHLWGTTPRNFSPCGTVLDTDSVQLMSGLERHFTYFTQAEPRIEEALLVPFHVGDVTVGTMWVISHDNLRKFDSADASILETLGEFAAAAYQVVQSQTKLEKAIADLRRINETLRQTELALTTANTNLEQFAFAAVHDLQQPLRTITAISQLLREKIGDKLDPEAVQLFQLITDGGIRMRRLLDDLLQYSLLSDESSEPAGEISIQDALDGATANLQHIIQEHGATVTSDRLPRAGANQSQITLVLQNLILNSIKYRRNDAAPQIHVSAARSDGHWTISVQDNGQGFPQELAETTFGMFKRLHGPEIPGTGMGLALCRKILQRHGGTIRANSIPGQGSVFSFALPVRDHDSAKK